MIGGVVNVHAAAYPPIFIVVLPHLVLGKTSHFGSDIYNNVYNIIL